jgi:hypothetical protein
MEIIGKVKLVNPEQQVSPTFRKRDLVITTDEQYPQHILVEFLQDKADLLNQVQVGEPIKVSINLRGREWQSPQGEIKYFNSITGWKIDKIAAQPVQPAAAPNFAQPSMPASPFPTAEEFNDADNDDLPF